MVTTHPFTPTADFAIVGDIDPNATKPEGPFGDHLGYYSLQHPFPVLRVKHVWHRDGAIWPFTVVGRPPQEDTTFGQLIHELTDPIIPTVLPGVKGVHAVDASGVHPMLLAIGSERYMPYLKAREPQELLTQANAILGNGQLSLAKYLWITDDPNDEVDIHDVSAFLQHILQRCDWRRDLHFQTKTTIDTLDYSGTGLNQGSKLIIAATGEPVRQLPTDIPVDLSLPAGFSHPRVVMPGVLAVQSARYDENSAARFIKAFDEHASINQFPFITLVDDSEFASATLNNWIWVTFTRSNPAVDVDGIAASTRDKHWGCRGALVIDARIKPGHAPPLIEDAQITSKVDARAARGGPLAKYL